MRSRLPARRRRPDQELVRDVRVQGLRFKAVAPGPSITNIVANWGSQLAAERLGPLMQATVPTPATAAQLAASITFLLSDDGTNINGAIPASDGDWSALLGSGAPGKRTTAGSPAVVCWCEPASGCVESGWRRGWRYRAPVTVGREGETCSLRSRSADDPVGHRIAWRKGTHKFPGHPVTSRIALVLQADCEPITYSLKSS
ncbi:hypothetical protein [Pseudarthrobacter sp. MM222]|uniref:hypothetical protein n=1 Tax=Pseudarthrobacter sp. MM222 TaxID=3018929 RepID=UPI00221FB681|nr:hypothetical protein [Pseudarthrobacter sp. MM222]